MSKACDETMRRLRHGTRAVVTAGFGILAAAQFATALAKDAPATEPPPPAGAAKPAPVKPPPVKPPSGEAAKGEAPKAEAPKGESAPRPDGAGKPEGTGQAEGPKADGAPKIEAAKPEGEARPAAAQGEVQKYCANIAGAAMDAKYGWQAKKLKDLEDQVSQRIDTLDGKIREYKDWMAKRDALAKKAQDSLVAIYSTMKPETAAAQIGALDDDMAAAVIGQLKPRTASAILNEFQADHAARIANALAARSGAPSEKKL